MPFGVRLKTRREKRHLSQAALGRLADVPQSLISMLEGGQRTHTTTLVLAKLAQVLGCTTDGLLGIEEEEPPTRKTPSGA